MPGCQGWHEGCGAVMADTPLPCRLEVWGLLIQAREFTYPRVLFTSDRKMEREEDRQFGVMSFVMQVQDHQC